MPAATTTFDDLLAPAPPVPTVAASATTFDDLLTETQEASQPSPSAPPPPKTTWYGALGRSFARAAPSMALAGEAGAAAASATAPLAGVPVVGPAIPLVIGAGAALGTMFGARKLQDHAAEKFIAADSPASFLRPESSSQDAAEHPIASTTGELLSGGTPNPMNLVRTGRTLAKMGSATGRAELRASLQATTGGSKAMEKYIMDSTLTAEEMAARKATSAGVTSTIKTAVSSGAMAGLTAAQGGSTGQILESAAMGALFTGRSPQSLLRDAARHIPGKAAPAPPPPSSPAGQTDLFAAPPTQALDQQAPAPPSPNPASETAATRPAVMSSRAPAAPAPVNQAPDPVIVGGSSPPAGASLRQIESSMADSIRKMTAWADNTIAAGSSRLHTGLDPALLGAYAWKGATLIASGLRTFTQWAAQMLRQFSAAIKPHLQRIWTAAQQYFNTVIKPARGSLGSSGGLQSARNARMGTTGPPPPESKTPKFAERVKQAATLSADFRNAYDPELYRVRTHEEWSQLETQYRAWISQAGPAAALDRLRDPGSTLPHDHKVLIAGQALRAADAAGDSALSTQIADWLNVNGSHHGQAVAAYGYLVAQDPTLQLEAAIRRHHEATSTQAQTDLGTAPDRVVLGVKRAAAAELPAAAQKEAAKVQRLIDSLARTFSDTPSLPAAAKADALRQLVNRAMREEVADFHEQAAALGLKPEHIRQLTDLTTMGRQRAAAAARERAGQALIAQLSPRAAPKARSKVPRLIAALLKAEETGVLSRQEFLDAYTTAFDLPTLTPELLAKLRQMARSAREAPEGSPRMEAVTRMQNELAIFSGIKAGDALLSAWYANLLSGITTQGINLIGNFYNILLRTLTTAAHSHPSETINLIAGSLRGFRPGWRAAKHILSGGTPFKSDGKYESSNALELIAQRGPPGGIGNLPYWFARPARYIYRLLGAGDAIFRYSAQEGRAQLAAARAARARGLRPGTPEFTRAVLEDLGLGTERWQRALDQARMDLTTASSASPTTPAINRRAWELIERERPAAIREESHRWGDLITFSQEPEGIGASIYNLIRAAQNFRVLGLPVARPFVPFARIVANLTSNNLDYTPIGILRGLRGKLGSTEIAPWEARESLAAGILGSLGIGILGSAAYHFASRDDADVPFMVYSSGPPSKAARDQMPKGWKPYTVKIGRYYWSYAESPLVFVLATIGVAMDKMRYKKDWNEATDSQRLGFVYNGTLGVMFSQGALSSMGNLLSAMKGERSPITLLKQYTSGVIPFQGFLRDLNMVMDPTKIDDTTLAAAVFRDIPVLRNHAGRPALNIWGEPVKFEGLARIPIAKRILDRQKEDPLGLWMARNKLTLPGLPQTIDVGQYTDLSPAARLNRLHAGALTEDERYRFAQSAGQLTRRAVETYQKSVEALTASGTEIPPATLQKRVTAIANQARTTAMLELMPPPPPKHSPRNPP